MKAKEVHLPHGVLLDDQGNILPGLEHLTSYHIDLLEPVDGIERVRVMPTTLRQVLEIHDRVADDHRPESAGYARASFLENAARRTDPALTRQQIDKLSGSDHDLLMRVLNSGNEREGNPLVWKPQADAPLVRRALVRLHDMGDRKAAEQRLNAGVSDDPIRYAAYLAWSITRFGDTTDFVDATRPAWPSFLNLTWNDFQTIYVDMYGRDYKLLTDIIEARMEVEGKPVPFPGVAGNDAEAPASDGARPRGRKP